MPETITVQLPEGQEKWRPDPFPGSDVAIEAGCKCPLHQPWPGKITFAVDCPVHELDRPKN